MNPRPSHHPLGEPGTLSREARDTARVEAPRTDPPGGGDLSANGSKGENHVRLDEAIVDAIAAPVVVLDRRGRIVRFNRSCRDISGYPLEKVEAKPFWDIFVAADQAAKVKSDFEELLCEGSPRTHENRWITQSGQRRLISWSCSSLTDADGRVTHIVGTGRDVTQQEEAKAELTEKERLIRTVAQLGDLVFFVSDPNGKFIHLTEQHTSITGRTNQEMYEADWSEVVHPDDRDRVRGAWSKSQAQGTSFQCEYRFLRPDGVSTWVLGHTVAQRNADGEITGYVGTITNIHKRKLAEEKLRASEASFADAQRLAHIGAWEFDLQTSRGHWSDEMYRIHGVGRESFEPTIKAAQEIAHPDDREALKLIGKEGRETLEFRIVRPDGTIRHVRSEGRIEVDISGRPRRIVGTTQDITEKRQAELDLKASEGRFRALADLSMVGIFIKGEDGVCLYMNETCSRMLGMGVEEAHGDGWMKPLHPDDRENVLTEWSRAVEEDRPFQCEYRLRPTDGKLLWVFAQVKRLRDDDGKVVGRYGSLTDITDRKKAEETLRHAHEGLERRIEARTAELRISNEKLREEIADRVGAERALREYQLSTSALLRNLSGAVYRILNDGKNTVDFISEGARELYGIDPEESIGRPLSEVRPPIHPDDRAGVWSEIEKAASEKRKFSISYRVTTVGGDEKWVWDQGNPRYSPEGKLVAWEGYIRDITSQKRAEERLRESEERYRHLVEIMNEGLGVVDKDGVTTFLNDRFCEIVGYPREELLNRSPEFLFDTENLEIYRREREKRRLGSSDSYEIIMTRKDGMMVSVIVSPRPIFDAEQQLVGSVVVLTDVTDRRRAEAALKESDEKWRSLVENSPDVVVTAERDGTIISINRPFLGREAKDFIGHKLHEFIDPADRADAAKLLDHLFESGRAVTLENSVLMPDNTRRWFTTRCWRTWHNGKMDHVTYIATDITERKRALEALQESEKLAATGRMAARVAHEINNPLAGIKNAFLLIKDAVPESHPHFSYVGRISNEIERMARIVRQMLDLNRPAPEAQRPVRLKDMIDDVVALLELNTKNKDVRIRVNPAGAETHVTLRVGSLTQVLFNLLQNAIEASPEGGEVVVTPEVYEHQLIISVADQGPGISEEAGRRIFEPFYTTKSESETGGLGLGLPISKGILEAMNGRLAFTSVEGKGALFRIIAPCSRIQEGDV